MKCRHEMRWGMRLDGAGPWSWVKCPDDEASHLICCTCKAQLPWGPSSDSDPRVQLEMRAAEMAEIAKRASTADISGRPRRHLDFDERIGWAEHFTNREPLFRGWIEGEQAGYLARQIYRHDEEQS